MTINSLPDPNVTPDFYSGVTLKRAIAWIIDVTLIAILCVLILPFTAFTGVFFFPFLMLTIGFFYRWFTIANRSSTWGMRMMSIEFRDHQGLRFESSTALAHTVGYTASVMMAPAQLISVILMLITPKGQGLTDHVLGTAAINRPGN